MIEQKDLAGSFTCTERENKLKVIRFGDGAGQARAVSP